MVHLKQFKKIEANLSKHDDSSEEVTISSFAMLELLNRLTLGRGTNLENISISQPSRNSLQIAIAKPLAYPLASHKAACVEFTQVMLGVSLPLHQCSVTPQDTIAAIFCNQAVTFVGELPVKSCAAPFQAAMLRLRDQSLGSKDPVAKAALALGGFSDRDASLPKTGSLFKMFEAVLAFKCQDIESANTLWVKALMQADLLSYLKEKAIFAIQAATDEAAYKLAQAHDHVRKTQDKVDTLNGEIAAMRQSIQQERDRYAKKLQNAQAEVKAAQDQRNLLNRELVAMCKTIQRERDRDARVLRKTQVDIQKLHTEVNTLQGDINSAKNLIAQLKQEMAGQKRWYDQASWPQKPYRWAEYSAYAMAKSTEIKALYTHIGRFEAAKASASVALEAASQALCRLKAKANPFPINADPRIVDLFNACKTANRSLEAADQTLHTIEASANSFPIDADPRIVELLKARKIAEASQEWASPLLEGAQQFAATTGAVSRFIVNVGLSHLLDVQSAQFESPLQAALEGGVILEMKVVFMQRQPQHLKLSFNFQNPKQTALDLANILLSP